MHEDASQDAAQGPLARRGQTCHARDGTARRRPPPRREPAHKRLRGLRRRFACACRWCLLRQRAGRFISFLLASWMSMMKKELDPDPDPDPLVRGMALQHCYKWKYSIIWSKINAELDVCKTFLNSSLVELNICVYLPQQWSRVTCQGPKQRFKELVATDFCLLKLFSVPKIRNFMNFL